jgi:hypothetical protein
MLSSPAVKHHHIAAQAITEAEADFEEAVQQQCQ